MHIVHSKHCSAYYNRNAFSKVSQDKSDWLLGQEEANAKLRHNKLHFI